MARLTRWADTIEQLVAFDYELLTAFRALDKSNCLAVALLLVDSVVAWLWITDIALMLDPPRH